MPLKLLRQELPDKDGRLDKIKALMLNEAVNRPQEGMARSLVMVSNDITAIVIDCIERLRCEDCLFAKTSLQKGGDKE